MLSELESRAICLIWRLCCKLFTIPLTWENGKLIVSKKYDILNKISTCTVVLPIFIWKLIQFPKVIGRGDVNGSILLGIFLIVASLHIVFKINIWLYKEAMAWIANQVVYCNSVWGKLTNHCNNAIQKLS